MRIDKKEEGKKHGDNRYSRRDQPGYLPTGLFCGLAGGTVDQYQKVMIFFSETTDRFVPTVVPIAAGLVLYSLDYLANLAFVLVLVAALVEVATDGHHVGQSPTGFGEIQHFPLDVG